MPANIPRLAKMIAHCEANQAWLESITYQMTLMPYKQQSAHLAGPIGLLKMFATRSAHAIADDAVKYLGEEGSRRLVWGRPLKCSTVLTNSTRSWAVLKVYTTFPCDGARLIILQRFSAICVRQVLKNMPRSML
jgi:alkylation response protein AidB-like acyl-CoA dehydrogenase